MIVLENTNLFSYFVLEIKNKEYQLNKIDEYEFKAILFTHMGNLLLVAGVIAGNGYSQGYVYERN